MPQSFPGPCRNLPGSPKGEEDMVAKMGAEFKATQLSVTQAAGWEGRAVQQLLCTGEAGGDSHGEDGKAGSWGS